jgi:fidgetin-like protein 1
VNSNPDKRVLVLAATNRPGDLDEACLRRLTRRIYMPLPDKPARLAFITSKFNHESNGIKHSLSAEDFDRLATMTEGYSMADLSTLVKEIAMMAIREMPTE